MSEYHPLYFDEEKSMINQRILILTFPSPPKERYLSLREYETYVRKTKESHMEFAVGEVTERRVLVDKKNVFQGLP